MSEPPTPLAGAGRADEDTPDDWDDDGYLLVVQGDARDVAGSLRAPLAVGVVRRGSRRGLVVKLSYRFDNNDEPCRPAVVPAAMALAQPSELTTEGASLAYASDFSLPKERCDVLLHGHAHAEQPATRIAASLQIGDTRRSFDLVSAIATPQIVLSDRHFGSERPGSHQVLAPYVMPRRSAEPADEEEASWLPVPQSAALQMQLPPLEVDVTLGLVGLSPRRTKRHIEVPALAPRALIETGAQELLPLPLKCDTLWLDTDLEQLVLLWRGWLPDELDDDDIDKLIVGLLPADIADDEVEAALSKRLPRGSFGYAAEEDDVRAGKRVTPGDDDPEVMMARYEALRHAAEPELSMAAYAAVVAALAEQDRPRDEVLRAHDYDEHRWSIEERAWTERLADSANRADGSLAAEFGVCFLAAQEALAGPHEPRSIEAYATLFTAIAAGDEQLAEVLAAHDIGFGEWSRLDRYWQGRISAEPETAAAFARLTEA